jgi:hypothetical protein
MKSIEPLQSSSISDASFGPQPGMHPNVKPNLSLKATSPPGPGSKGGEMLGSMTAARVTADQSAAAALESGSDPEAKKGQSGRRAEGISVASELLVFNFFANLKRQGPSPYFIHTATERRLFGRDCFNLFDSEFGLTSSSRWQISSHQPTKSSPSTFPTSPRTSTAAGCSTRPPRTAWARSSSTSAPLGRSSSSRTRRSPRAPSRCRRRG